MSRAKVRKPREWWVAKQNLGRRIEEFTVWHKDPTLEGWERSFGKVIHVREVLARKPKRRKAGA